MGLEADLQAECVAWFRAEYPGALLAYINNNSPSIRQGRKNKALGILAGMPDLILYQRSGPFSALCVEIKAPGGRLSPAQVAIHDKLAKQGFLVVVIRSAESFKSFVNAYMAAAKKS